MIRGIPAETDQTRIAPTRYDKVPYSPFSGGAFDLVGRAFQLEKDYLSSETLQTTSIAFEVPLESGLSGKMQQAVGIRQVCMLTRS